MSKAIPLRITKFQLILITVLLITCQDKDKYLPVVRTYEVYGILSYFAISGGSIEDDGGVAILEKGLVWDTITNPTLEKNYDHDSEGSGSESFESLLQGLTRKTRYFVRAYARNKYGLAYGNEVRFTTSDEVFTVLPRVVTKNITELRSSSVITGGMIDFEGTPKFTKNGICWGINPAPTINDNVLFDSTNSLNFSLTLKGLESSTSYHVRAFAVNEGGTGYGNEVSFTTLREGSAVVNLTNISNVDMSGVSCEGIVLHDDNVEVTVRGVCWSTNSDPLISNDTTVTGRGLGVFSVRITGLFQGTPYYIRAYATNSTGTVYSDVYRFTTVDTGSVVKDFDGNMYNTVTYGKQVWLSSNLKATRYQDGTAIGECWAYNNNECYASTYGRLYSKTVAANSLSACPVGWHVPTSAEWRTLVTYLESNGFAYDGSIPAPADLQAVSLGSNKLAKSISSDYNWGYSAVAGSPGNPDFAGVRNKTGFNAMPAGCKYVDGTFMYLGSYAFWWNYDLGGMYVPMTGGPVLEFILTQWNLIYDRPHFNEGGFAKAASIRCIKNQVSGE
jgi:uncharacterized protein (TIGR02145 family)